MENLIVKNKFESIFGYLGNIFVGGLAQEDHDVNLNILKYFK